MYCPYQPTINACVLCLYVLLHLKRMKSTINCNPERKKHIRLPNTKNLKTQLKWYLLYAAHGIPFWILSGVDLWQTDRYIVPERAHFNFRLKWKRSRSYNHIHNRNKQYTYCNYFMYRSNRREHKCVPYLGSNKSRRRKESERKNVWEGNNALMRMMEMAKRT